MMHLLARLDAIHNEAYAIADMVSRMLPADDVPSHILDVARTRGVAMAVRDWRNESGMGVLECKRMIERALGAS